MEVIQYELLYLVHLLLEQLEQFANHLILQLNLLLNEHFLHVVMGLYLELTDSTLQDLTSPLSKLLIQALIDLVLHLLHVILNHFDAIHFDLLTTQIGHEYLLIGQVQVLIVCNGFPDVGQVEWQTIDWQIAFIIESVE